MSVFAANTPAQVEFDTLASDGRTVSPQSATAFVSDENGVQIGDPINVSVTSSDTVIPVTIPAEYNEVSTNAARVVTVTIVDASTAAVLIKTDTYLLMPVLQSLSVPKESAMSVATADLLSQGIQDVVSEVWSEMSYQDKERALRDAWHRISNRVMNPFIRGDHERCAVGVTSRMANLRFVVSELTPEEFSALPEHFITALRRAQFIEACVLSGGDPAWERRQDGLISKTVGESSEMFSSRPISDKGISDRARREISRYMIKRIVATR